MKILVCGGAGFIGSAFIRNFLKNHSDSQIINLDLLIIGSNLENLKDIENYPNYKFLKDDIRNESKIDELVKDVDVVVNFAAESGSEIPNDIIKRGIKMNGSNTIVVGGMKLK